MYESIKEVDGFWPEIVTKQQRQFIKNGVQRDDINIPFSDWCISRQRYWGTPIPMVHCDTCGVVPDENTVEAPFDVTFDGKGNPIENHPTWKNCKCPSCGSDAIRETDTMDTFVQSSWYFIKYISDIKDGKFDDNVSKWFPIDYYIGGAEHAIAHMIYSRFFWRVFKKMGYIPESVSNDPFKNVITQGMVKKDGKKMSKSAGNGVSPTEIIDRWGADTCRMYIIFAAPPEMDIEWSDTNIVGSHRFMTRFWNGQFKNVEHISDKKSEGIAIQKIESMKKKIVDVYERTYKFNTIVAAAMEVHNAISRQSNPEIYKIGYKVIIDGISPITPHICEDIKQNFDVY
jgi:leucyl-tRNA synthetase